MREKFDRLFKTSDHVSACRETITDREGRKSLGEQHWLRKLRAEPLNSTREVDVASDHGEVQPLSRADIT